MNAADFGVGAAVSLGVAVLVFAASWLVALVVHRVNVVDVSWGVSFVAIAVVAAATAHVEGSGGNGSRELLTPILVAVWGLRLATYIGTRSRGKGEDPRYAAMLGRAHGSQARYALTHVFLVQAVVAWFVSLPVQAAVLERDSPGAFVWIGVAVWVVGVLFEAVGDAQLAAFKRNPVNRGKVMDRGLWHYTRHPNYFGDACVWVGLYLLAASHWIGALTILSPATMIYFLTAKTGKPLLEQAMSQRPGYADYVRRTSGFVPWPPKRDKAVTQRG